MKSSVVAAAVAAVACGFIARAETNQERGKRVVNECLAALGGDRFLNMQNRSEEGRAYSFYRDELSGLSIATIYTRYEKGASDTGHKLAVRERENFGKKQDNGGLFAEDNAWEITFRGARMLKEDRIARYKETTLRDIFYILRVRLHEPGLLFESRGADVLQNSAVEIVDITDADNRTTKVYFHQITKLPIRQVFLRRDPVTKLNDEEVTVYSKYRDISGVQWPFAIERSRNGEKIFQIFSEAVRINESIPDKLFELPAGAKVMKPI